MSERRTPDATLISALRILASHIQGGDGCANACLLETAQRLAELVEERRSISTLLQKVESLEEENKRLREARNTWCKVDGYPGEFETQPLPPGPEGDA